MKNLFIVLLLLYSISFIHAQENTEVQSEAKTSEEPKSEKPEFPEPEKKSKDSNQGEIREQRKWMVSLTSNGSAEVRAEYNVNSQFSVGTQFYKKFFRESDDIKMMGNTYFREENFYNRRGLELFGKYFIFEDGPVYLVLGAGKYLDSGVTRNTLLLTRNPNGQLPTSEAITNTTTINPYWYAKYGVGLQWIFDFGLLLNLEASALSPIHATKKSYTYVDERNFISNNYYSPTSLYLIDSYLKNGNPNEGIFQLNLWLGYAFKI